MGENLWKTLPNNVFLWGCFFLTGGVRFAIFDGEMRGSVYSGSVCDPGFRPDSAFSPTVFFENTIAIVA